MPQLAIDLIGAAHLGVRLAGWARESDRVADLVNGACVLSGLECEASGGLAEVSDEFGRLRRLLLDAAARADSFELPPMERMPGSTRFGEVSQLASHNTYQREGGLSQAHHDGFRAYELDLHIGAPTALVPEWIGKSPPWMVMGALLADAVTDRGSMPGDWHVFHHSADTDTAHRSLASALDELAALPAGAPITLFLDLKDPLADDHSPERLDALLRDRLGHRLYSPADVLARSVSASSVGEVVAEQGWPTLAELDGRVLVVLTAEVDSYRARPARNAAAFVAVEPTLANLAAPDVVFFNERSDRISGDALELLAARGAMVRTWGSPTATGMSANYVAID